MRPSIIIVDDEPQVIESLKRVLALDFEVFGFTDPFRALKFFELHPTHIVVSDMKMPQIAGEDFLLKIRDANKATRCCVITGYADVEAAQKVINKVQVSAYFNKPWSNKDVKAKLLALASEIKMEQLRSEKLRELQKTKDNLRFEQKSVLSVIDKMLTEQVAAQEQLQKNHEAIKQCIGLLPLVTAHHLQDVSGHEFRIAHQAKLIAEESGLLPAEHNNLFLACLTYRLGMNNRLSLSEEQENMDILPEQYFSYQKQAAESSLLLRSVLMFTEAADIILYCANSDFSTDPDSDTEYPNTTLKHASKILRLVVLFDDLVLGRFNGTAMSAERAFSWLETEGKELVDNQLLYHFRVIYEQEAKFKLERAKTCSQLKAGDVLARDLFKANGHKLLSQGTEISSSIAEKLNVVQDNVEDMLIMFVTSELKSQGMV